MPSTLATPKPTRLDIPFSFTTAYPLETCRLILLNSQVVPEPYRTLEKPNPRRTFKLKLVDANTYKFHADQRFGLGPRIIARGVLEKVDNRIAAVTGFVTIPFSNYVYFALMLLFEIILWGVFIVRTFFPSPSEITLIFCVAALLFGGFITFAVSVTRNQAREFAKTIENILHNPSANKAKS